MKWIPLFTLAALCIGFAGGRAATKAETAENHKIADGVYIGNVYVGGMTEEEAVDAISAYAQSVDDAVLTLNANGKSVEVSAQELGITFQNTNAVQEALAVGRNGNLIKRYKDKKDLEHGSKVFELPLGLNETAAREVLTAKAEKLNNEAVDNGLIRENGQFQFIEGSSGVEVNVEKSLMTIEDYLKNNWDGTDASIDLVAEVVEPAGAGYDNVDLAAATAKGIVVMNTPGQNSNAVAELALGMMVFMARNQFTPGTGSELKGKTLAIHAYGNVGKLVGRKGKALGMNVIAFDPFITDAKVFEADGVKKVDSIEELYAQADYLSLHIPATEQTKKSIGHKLMTSMPKGATLVNTARKEVIDEAGVIQAMTEREDLKYITDIAPEAAAEMSEKFGKRFFATPKKMGAETAEANINAGLAAANQIVDFFKTGNTRFQVNK